MSGLAMGENYNHLTLEERCRWRGLMAIGLGVGEIARRLGRHRGTIPRGLGHYHVTSGLFACPISSYTSQSGCAAAPGFATGFWQRVRYLDGQMAGATQETVP